MEDHDRVLAAMGCLPHRWQKALWYADVLQEQTNDIALAMGMAPAAVSALVQRARKGLRETFAGIEDGPRRAPGTDGTPGIVVLPKSVDSQLVGTANQIAHTTGDTGD